MKEGYTLPFRFLLVPPCSLPPQGASSGDPSVPTATATLVAPDESSPDALVPAAAGGSSVAAEAKKSSIADAGPVTKKSDSKPKPEPKPQVCLMSWTSTAFEGVAVTPHKA